MLKLNWMLPALLALSGCAAQPPLLKQTQSGMAEGTFEAATLDDVRNKLIQSCAQRGRQVREASTNKVVCSKRMEGGGAIAAQLALGNAYSTTPESVAQFTFYQVGANVNVVGSLWAETQMAFGQMQRGDLNSPAQINTLQQALFDLGAK